MILTNELPPKFFAMVKEKLAKANEGKNKDDPAYKTYPQIARTITTSREWEFYRSTDEYKNWFLTLTTIAKKLQSMYANYPPFFFDLVKEKISKPKMTREKKDITHLEYEKKSPKIIDKKAVNLLGIYTDKAGKRTKISGIYPDNVKGTATNIIKEIVDVEEKNLMQAIKEVEASTKWAEYLNSKEFQNWSEKKENKAKFPTFLALAHKSPEWLNYKKKYVPEKKKKNSKEISYTTPFKFSEIDVIFLFPGDKIFASFPKVIKKRHCDFDPNIHRNLSEGTWTRICDIEENTKLYTANEFLEALRAFQLPEYNSPILEEKYYSPKILWEQDGKLHSFVANVIYKKTYVTDKTISYKKRGKRKKSYNNQSRIFFLEYIEIHILQDIEVPRKNIAYNLFPDRSLNYLNDLFTDDEEIASIEKNLRKQMKAKRNITPNLLREVHFPIDKNPLITNKFLCYVDNINPITIEEWVNIKNKKDLDLIQETFGLAQRKLTEKRLDARNTIQERLTKKSQDTFYPHLHNEIIKTIEEQERQENEKILMLIYVSYFPELCKYISYPDKIKVFEEKEANDILKKMEIWQKLLTRENLANPLDSLDSQTQEQIAQSIAKHIAATKQNFINKKEQTEEEIERVQTKEFDYIINHTSKKILFIFNEDPEPEKQELLKKSGFLWTPTKAPGKKAWSRKLTFNASKRGQEIFNIWLREQDSKANMNFFDSFESLVLPNELPPRFFFIAKAIRASHNQNKQKGSKDYLSWAEAMSKAGHSDEWKSYKQSPEYKEWYKILREETQKVRENAKKEGKKISYGEASKIAHESEAWKDHKQKIKQQVEQKTIFQQVKQAAKKTQQQKEHLPPIVDGTKLEIRQAETRRNLFFKFLPSMMNDYPTTIRELAIAYIKNNISAKWWLKFYQYSNIDYKIYGTGYQKNTARLFFLAVIKEIEIANSKIEQKNILPKKETTLPSLPEFENQIFQKISMLVPSEPPKLIKTLFDELHNQGFPIRAGHLNDLLWYLHQQGKIELKLWYKSVSDLPSSYDNVIFRPNFKIYAYVQNLQKDFPVFSSIKTNLSLPNFEAKVVALILSLVPSEQPQLIETLFHELHNQGFTIRAGHLNDLLWYLHQQRKVRLQLWIHPDFPNYDNFIFRPDSKVYAYVQKI